MTSKPIPNLVAAATTANSAKWLPRLRRFARETVRDALAVPGAAAEAWSVVQEAAWRFVAGRPAQEQGWTAGHTAQTCWLGIMHELEMLRVPMELARAHPDVAQHGDG